MNESTVGREHGLEIRQYLFRPNEIEHFKKFNTDKSFKLYVANNSHQPPRVQAVDILDMELVPNPSNKLPGKLTVILARGHRDLAEFVMDHLGQEHDVLVYQTDDNMVKAECSMCGENVVLAKKSLTGNPDWEEELYLPQQEESED